ncbi:MAG: type IV pilus modification protein PilV [Thiobacillus sp.]|nr:type IV pilus modification protein PilV [Thiobacillus sp.]
MTRPQPFLAFQRGTSLLEVLVTIVILAIGLLGLAGLQTRLQTSEIEAYQRSQALILLNDMASRIATNRANAASYVTASPLGVGMTCSGAASTQEVDAKEWCEALQGAGETLDGNSVGAMVGGRGCVEKIAGTAGEAVGEYRITVAWQGLAPISAPPANITCGQTLYNGGTVCANDLCRRTVTTVVRIGDLAS